MMRVSWLFIALMLAALGLIVHAELAALLGGPERRFVDLPPGVGETEGGTSDRLVAI
jgi:hypothetical protein